MQTSNELPAKHIGVFKMIRKGERKSSLVLAGRPGSSLPDGVKTLELLAYFHHLTTFVLQTQHFEPGYDYPVGVYYRMVPPAPLLNAMVSHAAWEERKKDFISSFSDKMKTLREGRKSATIFNLEENGELTKLALNTSHTCGWVGVNIFGAGLSLESRDPFELPKQ